MVPEYWEWLAHHGEQGNIKMPFEIYDEVKDGPGEDQDPLFAWLQQHQVKSALLLAEQVDPALVQHIISDGYAPDLTDDELEQVGRDPFLIAYAMSGGSDRVVVTAEVSKPTKQRHKRKVPDVCDSFAVEWCNPFDLNRKLGFRTNWKQAL